jgi:hypothetical protein
MLSSVGAPSSYLVHDGGIKVHPKYIKVIDWHNKDGLSHVSIKVLKTGREYRLYDQQAVRFIQHYQWDAT